MSGMGHHTQARSHLAGDTKHSCVRVPLVSLPLCVPGLGCGAKALGGLTALPPSSCSPPTWPLVTVTGDGRRCPHPSLPAPETYRERSLLPPHYNLFISQKIPFPACGSSSHHSNCPHCLHVYNCTTHWQIVGTVALGPGFKWIRGISVKKSSTLYHGAAGPLRLVSDCPLVPEVLALYGLGY